MTEYLKRFNELLEAMIADNSSDLHIQAGESPLFRVDGVLQEAQVPIVLGNDFVDKLKNEILNEEQLKRYNLDRNLDFSYEHDDARFRINIAQERGRPFFAVRAIPGLIPNVEDLGLPNGIWRDLIALERGLVLVTGVTGSGKSTTLAALINEINKNYSENIICIEDPIEFAYKRIKSVIKQRELYRDVSSFASGVNEAMRQDPDVILIGEIRDKATAAGALRAAETGHLVFSTLHTKNASSSISTLIDLFPEEDKSSMRAALADNLSYVVSQQLMPGINGGRVLGAEILKNITAVKNHIRLGQGQYIQNVIQIMAKEKMITMNDHLEYLYKCGKISNETRERYSIDETKDKANDKIKR